MAEDKFRIEFFKGTLIPFWYAVIVSAPEKHKHMIGKRTWFPRKSKLHTYVSICVYIRRKTGYEGYILWVIGRPI